MCKATVWLLVLHARTCGYEGAATVEGALVCISFSFTVSVYTSVSLLNNCSLLDQIPVPTLNYECH